MAAKMVTIEATDQKVPPLLTGEALEYSALIAEEETGPAGVPFDVSTAPAPIAWHAHGMFALLGVGPGWLLCDALFLQIPWAQTTQPEGLALASWMMSAFNAANLVIFILLLAHRLWQGDPRQLDEAIIVMLIVVTILGLCAAAFFWQLSTERHSVALLGFSFVGGAIGALRLSVIMPWMLAYDERLISSAVLGGAVADGACEASGSASFEPAHGTHWQHSRVRARSGALTLTLLRCLCRLPKPKTGATAMIALAQQPGGARLFPPRTFFLVAACLALPSLFAFVAIKRHYAHLLVAVPPSLAVPQPPNGAKGGAGGEAPMPSEGIVAEVARASSTSMGAAKGQLSPALANAGEVPAKPSPVRPWLWHAVRLWLMFALMQSLVWGIAPSLLPFAARNAVRGSGRPLLAEDVLSYAIDLSYLGLVAGSYASLRWPSYRLGRQVLLLVALASVTIGMAYARQPLLSAPAAASLLITSSALMRFVDGYTTAMIFRSVSVDTRYGESQNAVQRAISLAERVSTAVGAFGAFWLVDALLRSGAGDAELR